MYFISVWKCFDLHRLEPDFRLHDGLYSVNHNVEFLLVYPVWQGKTYLTKFIKEMYVFNSLKMFQANIAAAAGGIIFFCIYLPYSFMVVWESKITHSVRITSVRNGILLPKLFWPTVRKNCSSDQEKFWNSRLKAKN